MSGKIVGTLLLVSLVFVPVRRAFGGVRTWKRTGRLRGYLRKESI